jgi:hypothetical protein
MRKAFADYKGAQDSAQTRLHAIENKTSELAQSKADRSYVDKAVAEQKSQAREMDSSLRSRISAIESRLSAGQTGAPAARKPNDQPGLVPKSTTKSGSARDYGTTTAAPQTGEQTDKIEEQDIEP